MTRSTRFTCFSHRSGLNISAKKRRPPFVVLAKRKDILTGSICSAQSAMGMPNVEAMLSEVRGCFLNRENGVWKFAECVAQRGANPLKTPKATKLFVLQFILKKSLLEPQPTPRPFSCALRANKAQQTRKEGSRRTRNAPASEIRKSKK